MNGFPKTIATKADLLNCLALAQATPPAFPASEVSAAIEQIEAGAWLHCPILSTDGNSVTVAYCGEAATGQTTGNGPKIATVVHTEDESKPDDSMPVNSIVTLAKALEADAAELLIPAPVTTAQRMGITAAELKNIKGVLESL